jgi:predicted NUDIX family phosphoesterase
MTLDEILKERNKYLPGTDDWFDLNMYKSKKLEEMKPSTKEEILYFYQEDLDNIPVGFIHTNEIPNVEYNFGTRSLLEYASVLYRHPIPYCIIKYKDKYFFILREKGSGEIRLIGKKGMVGGHIGIEDDDFDLPCIIYNGLRRELKEETGITGDIINKAELKGLIKSNDGVDADHLGLVYEIEINTDNIKAEEDGVLTGIWINKEDLYKHYDSFESWSKIVYDNLLK